MIAIDLNGPYKTRTEDSGLQRRMRTADHGLGIKHELSHKTRTKHYGLGMKRWLKYKTRTADLIHV